MSFAKYNLSPTTLSMRWKKKDLLNIYFLRLTYANTHMKKKLIFPCNI